MSKEVYKNIIKFGLDKVVVKTPILPCPDVIEWITRKNDHEHQSILNCENQSVSSYKVSVFNQMYHLKEAHIKVTHEWLRQKSESADILTIMKGRWSEGHFRTKFVAIEGENSKFRKSVQIIVSHLVIKSLWEEGWLNLSE